MKTVIKCSIGITIIGASLWALPPVRRKVREFTQAFHDAEQSIVHQLLVDTPIMNDAAIMSAPAAPVGVQDDDDWF